jgi:hypothetical protein
MAEFAIMIVAFIWLSVKRDEKMSKWMRVMIVNYPAHKGRGLLQAQPLAERTIGRLTAPLNELYSY